MPPLRIVDSITELGTSAKGCLAVSGSHGGLSSARYALAAKPLLSIFNDAGVGKDSAGLVALDSLQTRSLVACTVQHDNARISEAQRTMGGCIVSHLNGLAFTLGVQVAQQCKQVAEYLQTQLRRLS